MLDIDEFCKAVGTTTAATVLAVAFFSLKKSSRKLHNICRKPSVLFMRLNPFYEMAGGSRHFEICQLICTRRI